MELGLSYSIVAAFVWGAYLFVLKRYFNEFPATTLAVVVNAFAIVFYAPVTIRAVRNGDGASLAGAGLEHVAVITLTILTTAGGFIFFLYAIQAGEVSYVAPINKIVPVFVLPIEVVVLGQFLTPLQVAGVVVATLAVYVANYRAGSLLDPIRRAAHSRPAQLALLSAMLFAVTDVGRRVVLQELAVPTAIWVPLLLAGVLVVFLPSALRHPPEDLRGALPKLAGAGAIVAVGEHTTTLAFSLIPASIASPVVNTQAIVAVILGGVLLGEQHFRIRIVAAVLAVVGVTMIAI
ncbi:DMT family transporter [Natranaeroarchaeum sulfidigenes]|uniref:Permease of the drug/metabolite transporter (DMT) superfamily n=1 Tax=Natranaeroarchaeum sulfidigenes TaxID=2784880 RepID=A0A897MLD8_9EURY|nr:DMT family transporter [Natranaeroarchaeum sulfidigenes]QSG01417.1 Permease of the drug/metabolite transporter (DMT) superfamily [Natranaeroarchaeum sulfidigenes]